MNFEQSLSSEGLRTLTVNIPSAGNYSFQGTLTLTKNDGSAIQGPGGGAGTGVGAAPAIPSQVVTSINQNGSPIFVSQSGAMGFCFNAVNCAANDVITFVTSSALVQDQQKNAVKLTQGRFRRPYLMASSFYQISESQGLGTVCTVKVPNADQYSVKGSITLPTIPNGSPAQSELQVVVNQNGSPMYTGLISARGFETRLNCAASDTITVVLSSSAAVDIDINAIKSLISVSQGIP